MKISCRFKDGTFNFIPNVKWHPRSAITGSDGLWAFKDDVDRYLSMFGKTTDDIDIAEAPVELYHSITDSPWLVNCSMAKRLDPDLSLDDKYWSQH